MRNQRTSVVSAKPVTTGLAKQVGRMVEDAALRYEGGLVRLELVKGDPEFIPELYKLFDVRAAARAQTIAIIERPPWKIIRVGTHKTIPELRQAIVDDGNKIETWGGDILDKIVVASTPAKVNLVLVTVADLGFPNGATREQIYAKSLSFSLSICPAEVGPQLRLQYKDQPIDEWILVAMEPITGSDGFLGVFDVERGDDGPWLRGSYGYPDNFWDGSRRWVFRRE